MRFTELVKAKAKLTALKLAASVIPAPRPVVLLGEGSALRLCDTVSHIGAKRVLIVTDAVLSKLGVIAPITEKLGELGINVQLFDGVTPDPTVSVVNSGLSLLRQTGCDAVLAVGGGSSIDAAKVIALAAGAGKTPAELIGVMKARKPSLPLFCVPTTAGTGSEVTIGAVISDDITHQKSLVIDQHVVPVASAIDPIIMQGMPRGVTADTAVDALTHAMEAWMSKFANTETDYYASAAVRMVLEHLPAAYADGKNLKAREALGLAAHYGGLALNQAGLGYVHAFAHQLGAFYGVPHGRANAIVLPYILDFNRADTVKRLAELARKVGVANTGTADHPAADLLITRIKQLLKEVNIDTHVKGITASDFPAMMQGAYAEAHGTYAVPRYMEDDEAVALLNAIASA